LPISAAPHLLHATRLDCPACWTRQPEPALIWIKQRAGGKGALCWWGSIGRIALAGLDAAFGGPIALPVPVGGKQSF